MQWKGVRSLAEDPSNCIFLRLAHPFMEVIMATTSIALADPPRP